MLSPNELTKQTVSEMEDEIEEEEEIMDISCGEEDESLQKAKQAITCRSVTLTTLMEDGVIKPGEGVLSIDYLGQRFEADLLENGRIKWQGSEEEFGTPSAWALHCKRLVNPIKRSGCGWASVKYDNKKLDIWKSIWARKHRVKSPFKGSNDSSSSSPTKHTSAVQDPPPCELSLIARTEVATTTDTSTTTTTAVSMTVTATEAIISTTTALNTAPIISTSPKNSTPIAASPPCTSTFPKVDTSSVVVLSPQAPVEQKDSEVKLANFKLDNERTCSGSDKGTNLSHSAPEAKISAKIQSAEVEKSAHVVEKPAAISQNEATPLNLSAFTSEHGGQEVKLPSVTRAVEESETERENKPPCGRRSVSYHSLSAKGGHVEPRTLVTCEQFDNLNKLQPFTVSMTSNALLVMDFHCHLTKSEVVGYLGGRWDTNKQHLSIEQVFPACCRLGDKEQAPLVEEEIRRNMRVKNLMVVGWYHSHPSCQPDPSVQDIDCQMTYQLKMRGSGSTYQPCLGFIVSPFEHTPNSFDSKIQAFWVMPNLERQSSYNIPMHVTFAVQRDASLTEDVLSDTKHLSEYYSGAPDMLSMRDSWRDSLTYMDKVRVSLTSKLPEDQLDSGTFLDYVHQLLKEMK